MADFVEKATLLLIDQSTPNINKINAALSALMKTAAKPIVLKIDSSQLKTALGTLQALNRAQQASNRTQARSNLAGLQNRAAQAEIAAIARQHAADTRRQVAADMAGAKISQARAASMEKQRVIAASLAASEQRMALRGGGSGRGGSGGGGGFGGGRVSGPSPEAPATGWARIGEILGRSFNAAGRGAGFAGSATARGFRNTGDAAMRGAASATGLVGGVTQGLLAAAIFTATRSAVQGVVAADDVRARLMQSGLSPKETAERMAKAMEISRRPGMESQSAAAIADASLEVANQALTRKDAAKQMELLARNAVILGATFKDVGKGADEARQLGRALNLAGEGLDPTKSKQLADEMMRAIVAGGGDVTAQDARKGLQQLKLEALGMSAQAVGDMISMRDEGGRSATADMRMFMQELTRGNLNKKDKALQNKVELNLTDAEGKDITTMLRDKSGKTNEEAARQLRENPVNFVLGPLLEAIKAKNKNLDLTDAAQLGAAIKGQGIGQSGATFATRVILNRDQVMADRLSRMQVDLESALDPSKQSLRTKTAGLNSQFQNMVAQATEPMIAPAGKAIDAITKSLANGGKLSDMGSEMMAALGPALLKGLGDPNASSLSTAGLILSSAGSVLLSAASAIARYFGISEKNTAKGRADSIEADRAKVAEGIKPIPSAPENDILGLKTGMWTAKVAEVKAHNAAVAEATQRVREFDAVQLKAAGQKRLAEVQEAAEQAKLSPERRARQERISAANATAERDAKLKGVRDDLAATNVIEKQFADKKNQALRKIEKQAEKDKKPVNQNAVDIVEETFAAEMDKIRKIREAARNKLTAEQLVNGLAPAPVTLAEAAKSTGQRDSNIPTIKDATPGGVEPIKEAAMSWNTSIQSFAASVTQFNSAGMSVGQSMQGGITAGGEAAASAIRAALSTPVNVTVNTTGGTASTSGNVGTQAPP